MSIHQSYTLQELAGNNILLPAQLEEQGLKAWVSDNKEFINRVLEEQGIILIRGLKRMMSSQFSGMLESIFSQPLLDYSYRSTPRTHMRGNIYTASEYHSDLTIVQHNESSYASCWASRIGFYCQQPARIGGQTPIADSLNVYKMIPKDIRTEFERKRVRYVRNYGLVDLPWQEVFQTEEKSRVEAYCVDNGLDFEWTETGLRTIQINPSVAVHPILCEKVWFNQAHLFHASALPNDVRNNLVAACGELNLPRNCTFGDGSAIPDDMIRIIQDVYQSQTVSFDWLQNDVMLLDNMRYSHGRLPYSGARKVLVGMTGKNDWSQCNCA